MIKYIHYEDKKTTKKIQLPRFRESLFWDVDQKNIDPVKHSTYIIERILDFGLDKEVQWMWNTYSKRKIGNVVKKSRVLRPQSRSLWTLMTQS